ncbi:MAG: hypothetical protein ACOX01_03980 [Methanobrevibacter boviskoreani]|jgi:Ca2+/Na+ antiporter|uniref:hypothetical protein n=1 Tax=Methanobrevibacter boviskoreani TaxID=1348249 RepID=UPI0023A8EAF8|nr:hypothetical protein [Methanobrevibacter boviskoreani]MCI6775310.1 hypothetical protein [Methanobrevibacter boviskoreani]MCI6930472.1 hypothetical protein [Methanobrevibacter boviskoreani]MDD6256802.1 hypothetical protein [Methanobrevibacter boviskoreani]MDY5615051.1 hypothetical protein [Methanobrevibacter boviskoreani]
MDKDKLKYVSLLIVLMVLFVISIVNFNYNIHNYDIILDIVIVAIFIYALYDYFNTKDERALRKEKMEKNKYKGSKNIKSKK